MNWDASIDSLRSLEEGSIWGTSDKIHFPLKLVIHNYADFSKKRTEEFKILKEILGRQQEEYDEDGKQFEVIFA